MKKALKNQLKKFSSIFRNTQERGENEANTVMYITRFLNEALGYDTYKEISKEYAVKYRFCDIGIKIGGKLILVIEVKHPGIRLLEKHIDQAETYALKSGTNWAILTNGCEWQLYHLSLNEQNIPESSLTFKTDLLDSFDQNPDEVLSKFMFLHRDRILKGDLDKYWEKNTLLVPKSVAEALFREDVLRVLARELNRKSRVRVPIEDVGKALKRILDREMLTDLADLKIKWKRHPRKPKKVKRIKRTETINFKRTRRTRTKEAVPPPSLPPTQGPEEPIPPKTS